MNNTEKLLNWIFIAFICVELVLMASLVIKTNEKFNNIEEKLDTICKVDKLECEKQLTNLLLL